MTFEDAPGVVALIGNGVSLVYTPQLGRGPLAHTVESQFSAARGGAGLRELGELGTKLWVDGQIGGTSFDSLLGPLDRFGDALAGTEGLPSIAGGPGLDADYQDVRHHMRHLYLTGASIVLKQVAQHSEKDTLRLQWGHFQEFPNWLDAVSRHRVLHCFTLNYDALLDTHFLDPGRDGRRCVSDQTDDAKGSQLMPLPGGGHIEVLPLRSANTADYVPKLPKPEMIVLHHLHGSVQWIRSGGQVFKATSLDDIRDQDLFMAGAEPVVMLTDRKTRMVERWPFNESYLKLGIELRRATDIVVAGYGFGDEPVNLALRGAFYHRYNQGKPTKIAVFTSRDRDEVLRHLAEDPNNPYLISFLSRSLTHIQDHLPGALQDQAVATWRPG